MFFHSGRGLRRRGQCGGHRIRIVVHLWWNHRIGLMNGTSAMVVVDERTSWPMIPHDPPVLPQDVWYLLPHCHPPLTAYDTYPPPPSRPTIRSPSSRIPYDATLVSSVMTYFLRYIYILPPSWHTSCDIYISSSSLMKYDLHAHRPRL